MPSAPPILPDGLPPGKSSWQNLEQLTRKLKIGRPWIQKQLAAASFSPLYLVDDRYHLPIKQGFYSPEACTYVTRLARERNRIPRIGTYRSLAQAADELGTHPGWILQRIEQLGLPQPEKRRSKFNRIVAAIPQETIEALREHRGITPPPGWHNREQLRYLTGRNQGTIAIRLAKAGIEPKTFLSLLDGRQHDYYPPEAEKILGPPRTDVRDADGWHTVNDMQVRLDRTLDWMRRRLSSKRYAAAGQERRTPGNIILLHYPPWVLAELRKLSEADRVPEATDDWYTQARIAANLGKSVNWVRARLVTPQHAKLARKKIVRGRDLVAIHYPRHVFLALKAEAEAGPRGKKQEHAP